jgi:hypothetical protein
MAVRLKDIAQDVDIEKAVRASLRQNFYFISLYKRNACADLPHFYRPRSTINRGVNLGISRILPLNLRVGTPILTELGEPFLVCARLRPVHLRRIKRRADIDDEGRPPLGSK